jgi:spoIIIJ-associated protein
MQKEEIQNLIKELIEKVSIKTKQISVIENNPADTWFSVEVDEPGFFIDRNGEALQALNHLVRRIVETKDPTSRILVDINGFQRRRVESVRAIAHMIGERARYFKSNIEADPMSAFERRIVHEFLSDAQDLKTESIGFGPSRRVVVKYIEAI